MGFLISYQSLGMAFGSQVLFSELSIGFEDGEKIGLIGSNGSGKSTLLKIFADQIKPDTGDRVQKKYLVFEYLAQQDQLDLTKTIDEALALLIEQLFPDDAEKYGNAQKIIGQAEIPDGNVLIGALSGGWRKRIAITCALIKQPDLLFLDEPTNHLDFDGILWLEKILKNARFSFVLVSHDRYLLENVTNRIIELGPIYPGGYYKIEGNYSTFLKRREEFLENQIRQETVLANKMRREAEWLSRGPKARATKAQYRIDSAAKLNDELSEVKKRNRHNMDVDISFDSTGRKTKRLLEGYNLSKRLGDRQLFDDLNIRLSPGIFIGLLGANGSGKSTFLKVLNGLIPPDSGNVKQVDDLRIVMFDQDREQLDQNATLKTALCPAGDTVLYMGRPVHVVTWGKKFLFKPEQLDMPVRNLSGGEQARILIANLMQQPSDVLLLDEPTNDLDIQSLEILEESLREYPGAIVAASHDRYLLNSLATHVLGFDGQGATVLCADFNQWVEILEEKKEALKKKNKKPREIKEKTKAKKKFSYKHSFELEKIEGEIQDAEGEVAELETALSAPGASGNPDTLRVICSTLDVAQKKVEDLYARWEYLEDLKASDS